MPVITVSQLNNYMKRYIDQNSHLSDLWIKGEISNFKHHYSGHLYFTLKDEDSTLKAVMFKASASLLKFKFADGMKIIAFGKISVYEPSGTYQLYVDSAIPDGKGELYAAYEQLKSKLLEEGLFDECYKKKLPLYPSRIGVVTSVSGAAVQDIINVISRRCKSANLVIYPVKVQGIGASESICDGISYFSEQKNVDVIIIARGGGSIEDLWAFNEEKTARAIFKCEVPIISGVGHETDFTIADFVADMRAPTPSAAAEIATFSTDEIKLYLTNYNKTITSLINDYILTKESYFKHCDTEKIYLTILNEIGVFERKKDAFASVLLNTLDKLLLNLNAKVFNLSCTLEALSPQKILERGYSVAKTKNGNVVKLDSLSENDEFDIVFFDGKVECIVRKVIKNGKNKRKNNI